MKTLFTYALILLSTFCFGQRLDSLGIGSTVRLNSHELAYFDSIFSGGTLQFEMDSMRVAFTCCGDKDPLISKKEFFDTYILPFYEKDTLPYFSVKGLSAEEKDGRHGYHLSSKGRRIAGPQVLQDIDSTQPGAC